MDKPNYFEEIYPVANWPSPEEARRARDTRARQLRKEGWAVGCFAVMNPFDGRKTFSLFARWSDFTEPVIQNYDSRTNKGSTRVINPPKETS